MMVTVFGLCVLVVFGSSLSETIAFDAHIDLGTEESFIVHATEISNILQTLISVVKAAAASEGRLLNIPETSLPPDSESTTLEELFDKFERTCQSFRTKFLKFIKKELESIDPVSELVMATSDILSVVEDTTEFAIEGETTTSESPDHFVAVLELDSVKSEEEDNYLGSEVNPFDDSSVYTLEESIGEYEINPESLANVIETSSEESILEYDTESDDPTDDAASKSKDNFVETSREEETKGILEQFIEEMSKFGKETLEADIKLESDSERFLHRSGLFANERPLNFQVTPVPGVRGVDFPDYEYIPQTSFTCEDKEYIPGFYADLDVDCQVFHVCWPDRVESFLCPSGTQFNQKIWACDYWFNFTCSGAPTYYSRNAELSKVQSEQFTTVDSEDKVSDGSYQTLSILGYDMKIMPVQFSMNSRDTFASSTSEPEVTTTIEDSGTSLPVTEDLAHKIYEELYRSNNRQSEEKSENPEQLAVTAQPKRQRANAKFFRTKLDRSGHLPETLPESEILAVLPVTSESILADMVTDPSSEVLDQMAVSEESISGDIENRFFKKEKGWKKIYVDKDAIPVILNRLFDTADDVITKNILPFTREVLAASYSKHHKVKKH